MPRVHAGPAGDLDPQGLVIFAADLIRSLHHVGLAPEVEFITLSSYGKGTVSQGVKIIKDIDSDVTGAMSSSSTTFSNRAARCSSRAT